MANRYHPGPPIYFGPGVFREMNDWLPEGDLFLVIGETSADRLGIVEQVREHAVGDVEIFRGVEPNPSSSTVERGAEELRGSGADTVLAVGGGSVLDAAKFMMVLADQGGNVLDFVTGKRTPVGFSRTLIAVPTTPGTSSEITPFSVVTVKEMDNKVGLRHPALYPSLAVIDPELTLTLPVDQTVTTGLDILSHSMESYWAAMATSMTREMSLSAVRLVRDHLTDACKDGSNREHREALSLASIFAGHAFSNTGTTICHAISYPITMDTGLHHGIACALSLGPTYDMLRKKGVEGLDMIASAMNTTPQDLSGDLRVWLREMGAPCELERGQEWTSRIMSTEFSNFRKNFTTELTDDDVKEIIDAM